MVLLNCSFYGSKKTKSIKEQEDSGLLNILGKRTPLSQIPLVAPFLF